MQDATEHLRARASRIVDAALERVPLRAALLVGSAGRGDADFYSDLDLLVYVDVLPTDDVLDEIRAAIGGVNPIRRERTEHACGEEFELDGVRTEVPFITVSRVEWQLDQLLEALEEIDSPHQKVLLKLEALCRAGARRSRGRSVETPAGVPVPPVPGYGEQSADLVEAIAYGGFRPGEILAVLGSHYVPPDLGESYIHVCQRNVDGQIVPGTKSTRYPDKDVYLLGPLAATIARRARMAGPEGLLFPYPGTDRLWSESEYRNWREDYFVPIARSHDLGVESDDPYALRHIYATLRIAAHHPTLYIESSMGTGLVGKVYGGVIRRYEGKGPLEIDAEISAARQAALAKRPLELRWP